LQPPQFALVLARANKALVWDAMMATGVIDMLWVVFWKLIAKKQVAPRGEAGFVCSTGFGGRRVK
jgi:hypothetical protein